MGDAQANWPEAVAAANAAFKQQHPGVDVNVQYQSWGDHKTKFEATLAGSTAPDVIEFGNTDVPKYMAAGALAPLTRSEYPELADVALGLDAAGSYNGKLYAVPYYAGARGVIYRTDQYKRGRHHETTRRRSPSSRPPGEADEAVRRQEPDVLGLYFPGRYWYAAMSFVYD